MKRSLAALALVAAALAVVWLYARAPTPYARERLVARFHADRREAFIRATIGIDHARARGAGDGELRRLEAAREEDLARVRRLEVRGWEVVLLPPGARPPDPLGYLVVGRPDPSGAGDPPPLRGAVEVWVAPRGLLARAASATGLSP